MNIALVAHDARKDELLEWLSYNFNKIFAPDNNIYATGTTASLINELFADKVKNGEYEFDPSDFKPVTSLLSGPLGGDQQIGTMIAVGKIDILIFFCDNLITQGHHQDVGALVRLASLYNIAFATNRTTADMIITSPLTDNSYYRRILPKAIENYKNRMKKKRQR